MDSTLLVALICFSLGIVSFCFALVSAITQVYSVCKTNNTSGSSLATYIIFWICPIICLSWATIFYLNNATLPKPESVPLWLKQWELIPLILTYLFDWILITYILIVKIRHIYLAKKLGMTEFDLAGYLTRKKDKEYRASGRKFHKHPFFSMFMIMLTAAVVLAAFITLFEIAGPMKEFNVYFDQDVISIVIPTLSLIGAIAWELISWPQFITSLKTRDTTGISLGWAIFFPFACIVSFIYALSLAFITGDFSLNSIGGIVFNGMIVNFGILIIKLMNMVRARKRGLNEMEYDKKVLIPWNATKARIKKTSKTKKEARARIKQLKKENKRKALFHEATLAKQNALLIQKEKDREWAANHR